MRLVKTIVLVAVFAFVFAACGGGGPSLKIDKTEVGKGEAVVVNWTAPGSYAKNAWIGIIPSNIAHGSEAENDKHDLSYQYLNGGTSGAFTFTAPPVKGSFDFRMHTTDDNGQEVASVTFTVK